MQDPSLYAQIKSQSQSQPQFPEQEHLKCPRCDSTNTKFCYYNNYNLSQPRHFCKSCRRYWTKGGALRNIPVGGGSRKHTKRSSSSSTSSATIKRPTSSNSKNTDTTKTNNGENPETLNPLKGESFGGQFGNFPQEGSGSSFTSWLGTGGQFGNFLDGLGPHAGPALQINGHFGDPGPCQNVDTGVGNADGFLNIHGGDESGNGDDDGAAAAAACWNGTSNNGWPDLAMYTPSRSNFQ